MARTRRRRSGSRSELPKGAYRVPGGDYIVERWHRGSDGHRYRVRSVRRRRPDTRALADAFLRIARDEG